MNRGKCNECGREFALTQHGLVRKHKYGAGWGYAYPSETCGGSGKEPAPEMFPESNLAEQLAELEAAAEADGVEMRFQYRRRTGTLEGHSPYIWQATLPGSMGMMSGSGDTLADAVDKLYFYWKELT